MFGEQKRRKTKKSYVCQLTSQPKRKEVLLVAFTFMEVWCTGEVKLWKKDDDDDDINDGWFSYVGYGMAVVAE